MSYTPPTGDLEVSWFGSEGYSGPIERLHGFWEPVVAILPVGLHLGGRGIPTVKLQQFIAPGAIDGLSLGSSVYVTHDWEYVPPYQHILASWSGAESYAGPSAAINTQWSQGHAPAVEQYADAAGFDATQFGVASAKMDQWVSPNGWLSLAIPKPALHSYFVLSATWEGAEGYSRPVEIVPGWWSAPDSPHLLPSGLRATQWGAALAQLANNQPQTIFPFGQRMTGYGDFYTTQTGEFQVLPQSFSSGAYGQPALYNSDQHLLVFNDEARYTEYGTPNVYIPWTEYAAPAGLDATQYGVHRIEHEIRWVQQGNPYFGQHIGTATIIHRTRTVSVPWSVFTQYGTAMAGWHVELLPDGFSALQIPNAHHIEHGNVLYPQSFSLVDRWGEAWVSRSPRVLGHEQRDESLEFGVSGAELFVRYLYHDGYKWELEGTKWGAFTHVFNRDRTITVPGHYSFRSQPAHLIANAARALVPYPIGPAGFGADTFIADRERYLSYPGIDSFRMSSFGHLVHNAAFLVEQHGHDSLQAGQPESVESNLQTVRHHSGPVEAFGLAFTAFGERFIVAWPNPSATSRYGAPRVSLYENFIAPGGVAPTAFGFPVLIGPILRTLAPRWLLQTKYGDQHVVKNATPQIYPPGRPYTEFSDFAWVTFLNRALHPSGIHPPLIHGHTIQFRTRNAGAVGWLSFGNNPWGAQVRNALPDPPATRTIAPFGVSVPDMQVPPPALNLQLAYPDGLSTTVFGHPDMTSQGARTRSYYPFTEFGDNHRAELRVRYVSPQEIPAANQYGKPRLSPHTVWATPNTPFQAVMNNPGTIFRPINSGDGLPPKIGRPVAMNFRRTVTTWTGGSGQSVLGFPSLLLRRRFVHPSPINQTRLAFPVLLPHTRNVWGIGYLGAQWGEAVVDNTDLSSGVTAGGLSALTVGQHEAQNWRRHITPAGFAATQWGNNNPMVHFPRVVTIGNLDATKWGQQWISYIVREVEPDGFDQFRSYWGDFALRMRVRVANSPIHSAGADSLSAGSPTIQNLHQIIRPYMIPPPCIRPCGTRAIHG